MQHCVSYSSHTSSTSNTCPNPVLGFTGTKSTSRARFGSTIPKGPPFWKPSFMVVAGNSSWYCHNQTIDPNLTISPTVSWHWWKCLKWWPSEWRPFGMAGDTSCTWWPVVSQCRWYIECNCWKVSECVWSSGESMGWRMHPHQRYICDVTHLYSVTSKPSLLQGKIR